LILAGLLALGYGARKTGGAPVKKYVVDLSKEEAEQLRALTHKGACGARSSEGHRYCSRPRRGSPMNG
jgi:hypothetical protein